jgi:hypothetical protein
MQIARISMHAANVLEAMWNLGAWVEAARVARWLAAGVSVFMAAHYLASLGVPLGMARAILLGA